MSRVLHPLRDFVDQICTDVRAVSAKFERGALAAGRSFDSITESCRTPGKRCLLDGRESSAKRHRGSLEAQSAAATPLPGSASGPPGGVAGSASVMTPAQLRHPCAVDPASIRKAPAKRWISLHGEPDSMLTTSIMRAAAPAPDVELRRCASTSPRPPGPRGSLLDKMWSRGILPFASLDSGASAAAIKVNAGTPALGLRGILTAMNIPQQGAVHGAAKQAGLPAPADRGGQARFEEQAFYEWSSKEGDAMQGAVRGVAKRTMHGTPAAAAEMPRSGKSSHRSISSAPPDSPVTAKSRSTRKEAAESPRSARKGLVPKVPSFVQPAAWQLYRQLAVGPKNTDDNYAMSDREDDDEVAEIDRSHKHVPNWAVDYMAMLTTQTSVDPDSIFGTKVPRCELEVIFTDDIYVRCSLVRPKRKRGSSCNWDKDCLGQAEVNAYKAKTGQKKCWKAKGRR